MSLKLYYAPGACSFVPHALLEASGAPFEPVLVKIHKGEQNSPEYKAINPHGQVPVLVDGDSVITQIVAIVSLLNDRFSEAGFLPRDPLAKAKALETLAWMNNTVHPTFTHIFMPHKFTDNSELHAHLKAFNAQLYRGWLDELQ
ncbi:MAG: glutathione S-transferase family protein, partial [Burkholderiales bacterium]